VGHLDPTRRVVVVSGLVPIGPGKPIDSLVPPETSPKVIAQGHRPDHSRWLDEPGGPAAWTSFALRRRYARDPCFKGWVLA
jgi:hypothetical protein